MGVPPAEDMGINPLECPVGGKPMSIPVAGDMGKHPLEPVREQDELLKEYITFLLNEVYEKGERKKDINYIPYSEQILAKVKQHYKQEIKRLKVENGKFRRLLVRYKAWDKEEKSNG